MEELSGQEPRDRKWGHLRIKQHFGLREASAVNIKAK